MLLILTSEKDFAADYLIVKLIEKGLPYFRVNAEALAACNANFRLGSGKQRLKSITTPTGKHLDLEDVTAVWYRRAIQPVPSKGLSFSQKRFVSGELRNFWNGLVLGSDVLWVSPPHFVQLAENKLVQLQLAQKLDFNIPETLISSSPAELREFVSQVGSAICKPIFHGRFIDESGEYAVYTRRVNFHDFGDDNDLENCPVFLQSEIPRYADVRVTFVGEDCFVARIRSKDKRLIDWRMRDVEVFYEEGFLPSDIFEKCKDMMLHFKLNYAAFDFIETPNGDWFFLEVNPVGEWAWLEESLGFKMREAFIKLFYGDVYE